MDVLVLKTNVSSRRKARELSSVFDNHRSIKRWSVDTEDRDNVLRIVAENGFQIHEAVELIESKGFVGKELDC